MFGRSRTAAMKEQAATASALAARLANDKKFRKQLIGATKHGSRAKRRAASQIGLLSLAARLGTDAELRGEVQQMTRDLRAAWERLQAKRTTPQSATVCATRRCWPASAAASRWHCASAAHRYRRVGDNATPRLIESSIEVAVPVSTAYNQWTQFEEFPQFMEGVEEVRQLDDTRLHWVASVGGRRAEWDAKIIEQHPDRQISWMSEDGKKTRGTVTLRVAGENLTLVGLSLGYQAEGIRRSRGLCGGSRSTPGRR